LEGMRVVPLLLINCHQIIIVYMGSGPFSP
jgi:hypothetical protein